MAVYGPWIADAVDAYLSGTIKAMLVDDAYVPDPDATTAPTGSQVSGTGYTAGGVDVTSLVDISYDSAGDQVLVTTTSEVNFGPIVVTGIGGIVFYVVSGQPLFVDMFGSTDSDGSEDFVYGPADGGILAIEVG